MADVNKNLWAPWRMQYIRSLEEEQKENGCFLCDYWATPKADAENHVIWRGKSAFVVMNRFPYTNGHLLIALGDHKADLGDLSEDELSEMSRMTLDALAILRTAVRPQGVNAGYNLGHCAGAGLPGHLHGHLVPRWTGDTNFMAVLGDVRVVPDSLDVLYGELVRLAQSAGLRE